MPAPAPPRPHPLQVWLCAVRQSWRGAGSHRHPGWHLCAGPHAAGQVWVVWCVPLGSASWVGVPLLRPLQCAWVCCGAAQSFQGGWQSVAGFHSSHRRCRARLAAPAASQELRRYRPAVAVGSRKRAGRPRTPPRCAAGPPTMPAPSGLTPSDSCYVKHLPASYGVRLGVLTACGTGSTVICNQCMHAGRLLASARAGPGGC